MVYFHFVECLVKMQEQDTDTVAQLFSLLL